MIKILILYNQHDSHHAGRLVNGLIACGNIVDVTVITEVTKHNTSVIGHYDFIFVESSLNNDLSFLERKSNNIILFDMEDKPDWDLKEEGYRSLKDIAKAYVKYNYQGTHNSDNLKFVGGPQVDYIYKGAVLAKQVEPIIEEFPITEDIFFICGPTYLTNYVPKQNVSYIATDDIKTLVKRPEGTGHPWETEWLYNQRLDWMYQLSLNKELNILDMGFHFQKDINRKHPSSLEYHMDLFGNGCYRFQANFYNSSEYYTNFLKCAIGLCPAGVARSSYRLIELMALGRIILSTDTEDYKYLYNPIKIIEIPDGENIVNYIFKYKDDKDLLKESKENLKLFSNLTPEKMWKDFIIQLEC